MPSARRAAAYVVQAEVLGEREVEHEPAEVAILRDVADAGLEAGPCAVAGDLVALGDDAAGRRPSRGR